MKIGAVIVTHNRLDWLARCVAAVRRQSRVPEEIIIVNNGSTDGTLQWLCGQSGLTVITQGNLGGAGGFHSGLKLAFDHGHDWIWSMDDDGLPAADCLEQLIGCEEVDLAFRSPLVLAIDSTSELAFELQPVGRDSRITTRAQAREAATRGVLSGIATPFNGTLISRSIIADVGLPIASLFIWGDEVEFQLRAQRSGHKVGIITAAELLHPRNRLKNAIFQKAGRTHSFPERTGIPLRDYLAIRNTFYIEFRYRGFIYALRRYCYCVLFHYLEFGPAVAWQVFAAGQAGYWGYLKGHRKFL
jgi:rhamnopyranosyl-N-acetylglucosaminyl-diphospho-decaprenol beta-1,3/1,4-galactofuranosyltransferase